MHTLLRLCLWQALIISICCFSLPTSAEDDGIRIRGPKSTDAFPYDRYGPITSKDTLWNIALKVRPDPRLSVYQVMQALYENNPNAFKENNLNHMISGQYLKLPSIDVIRAINPDIAQQKSRSDDKAWQQKVAKVVKVTPKKIPNPEEASVNKKDLDAAKSEINTQLQTIDNTQQQRLATIQNDVLDSIDGLQSLLKENEALRERLTSFNDQLGIMQSEVAKSKEIKVQMDDMISLQQELLTKAEAREQALLLEKQKAELEEGNLMSSSWFIALMATLPALLVLSLVAILFRRKNNKDSNEDVVPDKAEKSVEVKEKTPPTKEAEDNELTLEDELSLDDELSLEDELSLDDELSIDLSENDEDHEDLFSDDLDALDEDVIQLDDDLDDLDELEDIALDNNEETIALDDDQIEGEPLEGGQLDQSDLDSLFAGLEDEVDNSEEIALDSDEIALDELDTLLSEGKTSESEKTDAGAETVLNDDEDIDSLLDAAAESNDIDDNPTTDISEVSEPDDIDALLDAVSETKDSSDDPASIDVSDPDDIDALLDSINGADEPSTATDNDTNANVDENAESNADIADPDDIDALLDSINGADEPSSDNNIKAIDNDNTEDAESNADIADPDDIDALLDSINGADEPSSDNDTIASVDENIEDAESNVDIADPDDIDALLDSINSADEPSSDNDTFASVDENIEDAESNVDIADPDDIDALLDSINGADEPSSDNNTKAIDDDNTEDAESNADIAAPDDIDALLDSINGADEPSSDNNAKAIDDDNTEDAKSNADIADPDDIDALLDSINGTDEPTADKDSNVDASLNSNIPDSSTPDENTPDANIDQNNNVSESLDNIDSENTALIDNFTDEYVQSFIDTDLSEIANEDAEKSLQTESDDQSDSQNDSQNNAASDSNEDISDDFDIDALIEEVNHHPEPSNEDTLEIGDDVLDTELQDTDSSNEKLEDKIVDATDLDDETLAAISGDFDESTLTNLLNDEKTDNNLVELSPDFTDSNVLADLLSDDDSPIEEESKKSAADNAEEVAGIKELDNLDFDDLLANIEEESGQASSDEFEFSESFDIGDDFESDVEEDLESESNHSHKENNEEDFISVDSLLSDSLLDGKPTEPYEKMKIDVGLSEFPEFSGNITDEDIDDDDNGIAAKLDLAKVYIEIGDQENAEVILLDVVKQGDAQQQFDAQQLLDNLKD